MSRTQPRISRVRPQIQPAVVYPLNPGEPNGPFLVLNPRMAAELDKALAELNPGGQR